MQEWKASEKEAQKMTRDGAISVNLVTGEATHISDRPPEQDYSSADETAGVLNRAADEAASHVERRQAKKARHKRRDTFREKSPAANLSAQIIHQEKPLSEKAALNPDWVEWLMGFPPKWTDASYGVPSPKESLA